MGNIYSSCEVATPISLSPSIVSQGSHVYQYFTKFARKSLDSYEFKATLLDFFSSDPVASASLAILDWDMWFYAPGFPPKPNFDTSLVDVCYVLASKWETGTSGFQPAASDIAEWSSNQVVVFLERVQEFKSPLEIHDVRLMREKYGFAKSHNVEIVSRYLTVGLRAKDKEFYEPTAELLGKVGRMKFVRPL